MVISDHIKIALQQRYRRADFSEYFDFIEKNAVVEGEELHHILPPSVKTFLPFKKDPANLVPLTSEDHDEAHRLLGKAEPWLLRTARRALGYYD